jgi:hypothetical protein
MKGWEMMLFTNLYDKWEALGILWGERSGIIEMSL